MYHRIVAAKVRRIFADLNRGDPSSMLGGLADDFVYRFHGESALSGERRSQAAMRAWWERVYEVLPGVRFDAEQIMVAGWPGDTRVATLVRVSGQLADGSPYRNSFGQFLRLRRGKVTEIETIEDTARLAAALAVQAQHGIAAAAAAPITG